MPRYPDKRPPRQESMEDRADALVRRATTDAVINRVREALEDEPHRLLRTLTRAECMGMAVDAVSAYVQTRDMVGSLVEDLDPGEQDTLV